ncbi:hypothetical protein ACB092_06G158400 [Castanea dentata]
MLFLCLQCCCRTLPVGTQLEWAKCLMDSLCYKVQVFPKLPGLLMTSFSKISSALSLLSLLLFHMPTCIPYGILD